MMTIDLYLTRKSWWWIVPAWGVAILGVYQVELPGDVWIRWLVLAVCLYASWNLRDKAPEWSSLRRKKPLLSPAEAEACIEVLNNSMLPEGYSWKLGFRFVHEGVNYYSAVHYRHKDVDGEIALVEELGYFDSDGRPLVLMPTTTDMIRSGPRRDVLDEECEDG